MDRRGFVRACAAGAGLPLGPALTGPVRARDYAPVKLLAADGGPLKAASLVANRNYLFFYPYQGTPCFLINMGRPIEPVDVAGESGAYRWPGGAGHRRSLVAYSAICSHQLTYPTREISFISFRPGKSGANRHADVIHCCSEHSQYDPARGAKVLAGPAPRPLAAILLRHDPATDALTATGTLGNDVFDEFFRKYEVRLMMDGGGRARQAVADASRVVELDNYCRQQVRC
ncbi:MAG: (2Fe-2S)-binding protein [Burkholderiales bacterium]